jgi:glycosyltransferase involved in cell wall biosynthesis
MDQGARIRLLTFSTLYPNAMQPSHGIFVENRLRHLVADGRVEADVIAPVAWFPSGNPMFGTWAVPARVPAREVRHGIEVLHPRYPLVPKIGMAWAPAGLAWGGARALARQLGAGRRYDAIDAHFLYPDGVAALALGRRFGLPVVMTARGTDVNDYPDRFPEIGRRIVAAAREADAVITVCQALKDRLVALGVPEAQVTSLRNGVDLVMFRPEPREAARAAWQAQGFTLASVGHLIPRKGHDLVIRALAELPDVSLMIAGDGPEHGRLTALAAELGVADRVRFLGRVAPERLASLYSAADALVLASIREGWANVLLEAMACGTPVVATDVWGTREAVTAPEAGVLVDRPDAPALAQGVRRLRAALPDRCATRAYAEAFSWDATTEGQIALFRRVLARHSDLESRP